MDLTNTQPAIDPVRYGRLPATELPKAAKNDEEYAGMVDRLEALEFPDQARKPEEEALRDVLTALVQVYEPECKFPKFPPCGTVKFYLDQRGLRQADLVPVLGSRAQVSDIVNGKRGISIRQAESGAGSA